jgi:hypothetical protein
MCSVTSLWRDNCLRRATSDLAHARMPGESLVVMTGILPTGGATGDTASGHSGPEGPRNLLSVAAAALVISICALIIAALSERYTRQQAHASRQAVHIDEQRRRDERRPHLVGDIESMGSWDRLRLRLETPWPLVGLDVTIAEGQGISFTRSQDGVDPSATYPILNATSGPVLPGDTATLDTRATGRYAVRSHETARHLPWPR